MRAFYIKHKTLIILWLMCIMALIVFTGHYSNLLLDVGREVYYPERILEGKVLYKDLFNIYGPFSYLWNAFLYKILGINLSTLYFSGAICSIGIVSGIYLIAKKFLNTPLSFAIAFFTIVTGICANHLFNFTFPYSWAMLYGTVGFLYSVYFLIKYKETSSHKYLYLSGLLAGFAVANKYDFIIYAVFLFIVSCFLKKKIYILNFITLFLLFPLLSFGILFIQGVRIEDLLIAADEVRKMLNTKTLTYFYSIQGVYFNPQAFLVWGINLLKTGIPFVLMILSYKTFYKNKLLSIIFTAIFACLVFYITGPAVFVFVLPLMVLFAISGFKKLKTNIPLFLLILSALTVSVKIFWGSTPLNYGNYFMPVVLTAFFSVLFTFINKKYQKVTAIFLIAVSLSFLNVFIGKRALAAAKISAPHGKIYTTKPQADAVNEILSFLNNYDGNVKAIIYPEGLILNFLSKNNIKSTDYYNSLLPLYLEAMGESTFINLINETKPDFIILNNQSMRDYYFEYICIDYAQEFCAVVERDYEEIKQIKSDIAYAIFQRKK